MWLDREEHVENVVWSFKWLIKAMEDKVGEKMPVTQTYRPNLQIDVVLVC